jgi:hypothetical protein
VTQYYVDGVDGNDGNSGLSVLLAWKTIGKANTTLVAGDTVDILADTYNERIDPSNNGSSGNRITYRQYQSETVIIAGVSGSSNCVRLNPSKFITIDGLTIRYGGSARTHSIVIISGSTATDNEIKNCTITRPGSSNSNDAAGWDEFGVAVRSGAQDNLIENCTMGGINQGVHMNAGPFRTTVRGCTIDDTFNSCIVIRTTGTHPAPLWGHLIENNTLANSYEEDGIQTEADTDEPDPSTIVSARGIIIRNNIIRDNGENAIDMKGGGEIVIEGNTIYGTVGASGGPGNRNALRAISRGANRSCRNIIIRHNAIYDNGNGIHIRGDNYKIYHNTLVSNNRDFTGRNSSWDDNVSFWGLRHDSASHDDHGFKNNIMVFHNEVSGHWHQTGTMDIDYNCYDGPWEWWGSTRYSSLSTWQTALQGNGNYTGEDANSIEVADVAAVKFTSVPNDKDQIGGANMVFTLQSSSPCVDAGGPLTECNGGGSGVLITVDDARYFSYGYGANGVDGDTIVIGTDTVEIVDIDYSTNELTVTPSISWVNNDPVYWPYEGSAPDIGAFELVPEGVHSVVGRAVAGTIGVGVDAMTSAELGSGALPVVGNGQDAVILNRSGVGIAVLSGSGIKGVPGLVQVSWAEFQVPGVHTFTQSGLGISDLSGTGERRSEFGETGLATLIGIATGLHAAALQKTGRGVADLRGIGIDSFAQSTEGGGILGLAGAGLRVAEFNKIGVGELGMIGIGEDALIFAELGKGTLAFVGSGTKGFPFKLTGSAISELSAAGVNIMVYGELGAGISPLLGSGSREVNLNRSGIAVMPLNGAGVRSVEYVEEGLSVLIAVGSGEDTIQYQEDGSAVFIGSGTGLDSFTLTESGLAVAEGIATGTDIATLIERGAGVLPLRGSAVKEAILNRSGTGIVVLTGGALSSEELITILLTVLQRDINLTVREF